MNTTTDTPLTAPDKQCTGYLGNFRLHLLPNCDWQEQPTGTCVKAMTTFGKNVLTAMVLNTVSAPFLPTTRQKDALDFVLLGSMAGVESILHHATSMCFMQGTELVFWPKQDKLLRRQESIVVKHTGEV